MTPIRDANSSMLLLYPSVSLMRQIAAIVQPAIRCDLLAASPVLPSRLSRLPEETFACLIDATDRPEKAMKMLEWILGLTRPPLLGVYTEVVHPGLEVFVRLRGSLLYLGPMTDAQWLDLFANWRRRASSAQGGARPKSAAGNPDRRPAQDIRHALAALKGRERLRIC